ncbi:MAG TPA: site-2 protease family protein [Acidimicrobiales bacterium]|nr:site-2 protease family protein [Acidimicrobiales bacterium]
MTLIAKEPGAAIPPAAEPPDQPPVPPNGSPRQVLRLLAVVAVLAAIFIAAGLGDLLLFIVILVVIVMLHELGHFATAKWAGMKVTEYFVGFGPRLWSFRRGETEYGIKAIPAGGYVRITGFTVLEDVAAEDEPRTYRQQAFWKRIVVASAGSVMHFIIAFVLALIVVFSFGVQSNNAQIGAVAHWVGFDKTPAQAAGLKAGDIVVSVNGHPLTSVATLTRAITHSVGTRVVLGVERNGTVRDISVVPHDGRGVALAGPGRHQILDPATAKSPKGYIGVELDSALTTPNPLQGIGDAGTYIGRLTSLEVSGVARTFSPSGIDSLIHQVTNARAASQAANNPQTSVRPVSLVGITSLGVQAQQAGLQDLLSLIILVNIVFGLLNMLPMLPLDGGHVAVAVYEWIRTKKGQAFYRADITKLFPVVFVFLTILALFVFSGIYLDFTHPIQNFYKP